MQWLQDPNQVTADNLKSVRQLGSRHFWKKKEHLKGTVHELKKNSKNRNIRDMDGGINDFKQGYQPRADLAKDKKGDLIADSNSVLNKWNNHICL